MQLLPLRGDLAGPGTAGRRDHGWLRGATRIRAPGRFDGAHSPSNEGATVDRTRTSTHGLDLELACALYREHTDALAAARHEQRELLRTRPSMKARLDDIEAELTYLLVRERRPEKVVELGALHGWSTTWLLRALRDNGTGVLHTFDLTDRAAHVVPTDLAADRWTFHHGDVRAERRELPNDADHLFVDAAHTAGFAHWYTGRVFPSLPTGCPVSVHDVFHGRRAKPFSEGSVVLAWLAEHGIPHFTASAARAPEDHRALWRLREELGLSEPVRGAGKNPMIFFRL